MINAKTEAFDRDIKLLIDRDLSPEARSRQFGRAARQIIDQQDAVNDRLMGRDVTYETRVDGRPSIQLERAKRRIVATWDLQQSLFTDILKLLRDASPVLKGEYRDSITLFADNAAVSVKTPPQDALDYYFAATVPYARKIERGHSAKAPNGVFEAVAAVAAQRFGNLAVVRFTYRSVPSVAVTKWADGSGVQASASIRNRQTKQRRDWLTRQPAISIRMH